MRLLLFSNYSLLFTSRRILLFSCEVIKIMSRHLPTYFLWYNHLGGDVLMNIEQIAHDLAIAKLTGSDLSPEEMLEKYHEYYETFLNLMREEPDVATICSPQI